MPETETEKELRKKNLELITEVQALRKLVGRDVKMIGGSAEGIITLTELEATVNVLRNYRNQGFKSIQLI